MLFRSLPSPSSVQSKCVSLFCETIWRLSYQVDCSVSPTTWSSSPFRSPTFPWKPNPLTETAILCKCTLTSVQVRLAALFGPGLVVNVALQSGHLAIGLARLNGVIRTQIQGTPYTTKSSYKAPRRTLRLGTRRRTVWCTMRCPR